MYRLLLVILLAARVLSETFNTYIWNRANEIWSLVALACIAGILFPLLTLLWRKEGRAAPSEYLPILGYLAFLALRSHFNDSYSLKCYFSEFIVWFCTIFTIETSSRFPDSAVQTRKIVVLSIKIVILAGILQIFHASFSLHTLNPLALIEHRPVKGIFVHPSIFLALVFPFSFYFLAIRSYVWLSLSLFACLLTGTRALFLSAACMSILVYKTAFHKEIRGFDVLATLLIITAIYGSLIKMNSHGWSFRNTDTRFTFATLQWRVSFWRHFLTPNKLSSVLVGNGVGSSDFYASRQVITGHAADYVKRFKESGIPPHNDYIRIYFDTGIVGLFFFVSILCFMVSRLVRASSYDTSFLTPMFLSIVCFHITDNFVYVTNPIILYAFIGSFISMAPVTRRERAGIAMKPQPLLKGT